MGGIICLRTKPVHPGGHASHGIEYPFLYDLAVLRARPLHGLGLKATPLGVDGGLPQNTKLGGWILQVSRPHPASRGAPPWIKSGRSGPVVLSA